MKDMLFGGGGGGVTIVTENEGQPIHNSLTVYLKYSTQP